MDIESLKTFLSIAENKSFSKAAKELHITQPTISARMTNLESAFGVKLFTRSWDGVQLTNYGIFLIPYIINIVNKQQATVQLSNTFNTLDKAQLIENLDVKNKTLRIGINHYLVETLVSPISLFLQEKFPDLHFEFITESTHNLDELLKLDVLDLSVCYHLPDQNFPDFLKVNKLVDDKLVLAGSNKEIKILNNLDSIQDYKKPIYINSNPTIKNHNTYFNKFIQEYPNLKIKIVNSLYLIRELVKTDQGVTVIPIRLYEDKFKPYNLKEFNNLSTLPPLPIYSFIKKDSKFQKETCVLNLFLKQFFNVSKES